MASLGFNPRSLTRVHYLIVLGVVLALLGLHQSRPVFHAWRSGARPGEDLGLSETQRAYRERVERVKGFCRNERDGYEKEYGRANLRMARGYEGSGARLKSVINRALQGEALTMSVLGGSITRGFQVWESEIWFNLFVDWFRDFIPNEGHSGHNGAMPATGSDYFSYCFSLHVPPTSDLIFLELSVNDELDDEHTENMENLIRGLLELPQKPAVVVVESIALSFGKIRYGGDVHLPVAIYYDVPVITMRNALAPHFMRHPELVYPYFCKDFWDNVDLRHVNSRGHRDMSRISESLVLDFACELVDSLEPEMPGIPRHGIHGPGELEEWDGVPEQTKKWGPFAKAGSGDEPSMQLGCWPPEDEIGEVPKVRFQQQWPHSEGNLPLEPQCFSVRSDEHHLTPVKNHGWEEWFHPERPDKIYLFSNTTNSRFSFDIETRLGIIKMYSLRSAFFGLGSAWCWVGDNENSGMRTDGYWDNTYANIGRFSTIASGLPPGVHRVTCKLMKETADPGGGREFRILSIMSL